MYRLILFLGICVAFAPGSKLPVTDKKVEKMVGCSYRMNGADDQVQLFVMEDIDVSLCTHIFYSSVGLNENATVDISNVLPDIRVSGFKRFNALRKKKPNLKTLLSIVDSTDLYDSVNKMTNVELMTNPTLREKLINNIVNFVKKYGFNGIDLKFTDPPKRDRSHSVKENLVSFLKALREEFDKERLIVFATVNPNEATAKILYDIKGISKYVNFMNLWTIDFDEGSDAEKKIGASHPSPMHPSSKENAEERKKNFNYVVKYWISQGAPSGKLVLTIAFDENINVESIKKTADLVVKMNLGGALAWTIDDDDFDGEQGEKFPFLKTLNRVLRNKY